MTYLIYDPDNMREIMRSDRIGIVVQVIISSHKPYKWINTTHPISKALLQKIEEAACEK